MTVAIVLAAGKGTRMKSDLPKVAHKVAGLPMIAHLQRTISSVPDLAPLYVLGHGHEIVRELLPAEVHVVLQAEQRGTGHAVSIALAALDASCSEVLILYGDMPLVTAAALARLRDLHRESGAAVTVQSAIVQRPLGYGRIVRDAAGAPTAIVEDKWLSEDQRAIDEINTGLYVIDVPWLRSALPALPRHGDDEVYLTDVAEMAAVSGRLTVALSEAADDFMGINDRAGLAAAEAIMRRRVNEALMAAGVTLVDPCTAYIAADATIGMDSVIEPNVILEAGVTIGERCLIGSQTRIVGSSIGSDSTIMSSHVEFSELGRHVHVGPFSHLRPGTTLADHVHMGNFAETKNSSLGPGTKMGHFSYLGDTTTGSDVNVGAGTITANYDGTTKHKTTIGDRVFLGVGTMLRAPISVGRGAYTGAGSVVLHDVPDNVTVAGTPAHQLRSGRATGEPAQAKQSEE